MKPHLEPPPEFSRPFTIDRLYDKPFKESIEANEAERAALATRLKLPEIKKLEADVTLHRVQPGDVVKVTGVIRATVVQNCVVTLENFETKLEQEFSGYFAEGAAAAKTEEDIEIEDERAPEPIGPRGELDLGELVAQHLSLELDPYPRKPGAAFAAPPSAAAPPEEKRNPFAVLADFKAKKK